MTGLPPLKCDGCRACCLYEQIWIRPEMGDDPSLYETVMDGSKIKIAKRENGSEACRYLGAKGCTIYDKRPYLCREFDCRVYMFGKLEGRNRQNRRALFKQAPWLVAIFAAAKARLYQ
jgi:Fe-S-cluster containining protein